MFDKYHKRIHNLQFSQRLPTPPVRAPAVSLYVNSYVDFANNLVPVYMRYVVAFAIGFGTELLIAVVAANAIVNLGAAWVGTAESYRTAYRIFLESYFDASGLFYQDYANP